MIEKEQIDILYAENEPAHVELLRRVLQEIPMNPTLEHVIDGQQALDYLYRRGDYEHLKSAPLPRLIILDQRMPKIDGYQVLRIVKADCFLNHIPVVMLSATDANLYKQDDLLTADSYLVKPTDVTELYRMVETLCHRYLQYPRIRESEPLHNAT